MEKIPYLHELGVTAVELLPVFQFDPHDAPLGLANYWGYSPLSFFAPHAAYSSRTDPLGPLDEFRDMVKALHRAGIEVILDVVFNHTAEGDHRGPTLCFRGLDNNVYYMLEPDGAGYANYTGCGNTFNANQPDRAAADPRQSPLLGQGNARGRLPLRPGFDPRPGRARGARCRTRPFSGTSRSDPALAGTKLIAEAWDAAGLYQVGQLHRRQLEGVERPIPRRRAELPERRHGTVSATRRRLLASPDIYGHEEREPEQSINFVTCHDGFTLNDLVSYDREAQRGQRRGEPRRRPTTTSAGTAASKARPTIPRSRRCATARSRTSWRSPCSRSASRCSSWATRCGRTQRGNNNAYCQDNETSWFDWGQLERHPDLHRFVRLLNAARLNRDLAVENPDLTLNQLLAKSRLEWHGTRLGQPDWGDDSHSIALTAWSLTGKVVFHIMFNAWWNTLVFELPPLKEEPGGGWRRWLDTSLASPADIAPLDEAPPVAGETYELQPRSLAVMFARAG